MIFSPVFMESTVTGLESEQIGNGRMILPVAKAMEVLAVYPPALGLAWLQFYFHDTGLMVGLVVRRAQRFWIGILPGRGPAP